MMTKGSVLKTTVSLILLWKQEPLRSSLTRENKTTGVDPKSDQGFNSEPATQPLFHFIPPCLTFFLGEKRECNGSVVLRLAALNIRLCNK